jgi:hypothetical protein
MFDIRHYQRKIGSLLFAAVTTPSEISFATSRLARFLMNPSEAHYDPADRVLLYLDDTSSLSLELGGGSNLVVASAASFTDNTFDRKSSKDTRSSCSEDSCSSTGEPTNRTQSLPL